MGGVGFDSTEAEREKGELVNLLLANSDVVYDFEPCRTGLDKGHALLKMIRVQLSARRPDCERRAFKALHGIGETITKRIRRRGKKLVREPYIAITNERNEFCKPVLQRDTPFRSASTDVGQNWGRCNVDFQFMPRTLDPDHFMEGSPAQPAVLQVNPKDALAMCGVRMQMPDAPMLRRTFHALVAMFQAAHNYDFYITKYHAKPMAQLQSLSHEQNFKRLNVACSVYDMINCVRIFRLRTTRITSLTIKDNVRRGFGINQSIKIVVETDVLTLMYMSGRQIPIDHGGSVYQMMNNLKTGHNIDRPRILLNAEALDPDIEIVTLYPMPLVSLDCG